MKTDKIWERLGRLYAKFRMASCNGQTRPASKSQPSPSSLTSNLAYSRPRNPPSEHEATYPSVRSVTLSRSSQGTSIAPRMIRVQLRFIPESHATKSANGTGPPKVWCFDVCYNPADNAKNKWVPIYFFTETEFLPLHVDKPEIFLHQTRHLHENAYKRRQRR